MSQVWQGCNGVKRYDILREMPEMVWQAEGAERVKTRWFGVRDAKTLNIDEEEIAYSFIEWYNRAHQEGYSAEHIGESELERLYPAFRSWLRYKSKQIIGSDDATVERMDEYIHRLQRIIDAAGLNSELGHYRFTPSSRREKWQWYWRVFVGIVRRDHLSNRRLDFVKHYCLLPYEVRWKFRRFKIWYEFQVCWWMGSAWSPGFWHGMGLAEKIRVKLSRFTRKKLYAIRIGLVRREIDKWRKAYSLSLDKRKDRFGPRQ
jgi:hypothetical protein